MTPAIEERPRRRVGRKKAIVTDFSKPLRDARQELFCQKYAGAFGRPGSSGTQAAIQAGYSERAAGQIAFVLLKKDEIQKRVAWILEQAVDDTISTIAERKRTLTEIHRARLHHFGTCGADGFIPNIGEENLNSAGLGEVTTRIEIDQTSTGDGKGKGGGQAAVITKIKLRDPVAAIQELNKMDGAYPKESGGGLADVIANGIEFVIVGRTRGNSGT